MASPLPVPDTSSLPLDASDIPDAHARALELAQAGQPEQAAGVLREALRAGIDPEPINDLAVLENSTGEADTARDLLRAVARLYPEYAAAAENLAALDPSPFPASGPVGSPAASMAYYAKSYDNPDDCPADRDIAGYLDLREPREGGLTVFHFGTGVHHHIGLTNHQRPNPNRILAITASPTEYERYMELCLRDGALGANYLVVFGDIYNLQPELLPALDVASMPHLGEYHDPSTVRELGAMAGNPSRTGYALLDDRSLLELIVDKLVIGGRLLIYVYSHGAETTRQILQELVTVRGRLSYRTMHEGVAVFTKLR